MENLSGEFQGITPFSSYFIEGNNVFLVRKRETYTLEGRMCEYPALHDAEKLWITFQIFNSVNSLHEMQLVHGSLNPDNILMTDDLKTTICDMSPFKPSHIRGDKINLFYHYFTTATRSACYLAPEQVISLEFRTDQTIYNSGSFSFDVFSVALIIYFIYSGEHLFSFSKLIDYTKGKFTPNLDCIPENLRELTKNMLSLNTEIRVSSFRKFKTAFPNCFQQLFEQVCTFNEGGTTLFHVVALIPVFESLAEKSYEARIIFSRVFTRMLSESRDVNRMLSFIPFFADFSSKIEDEYVITRILPYFMQLLSSSSSAIVCATLRALYFLVSRFKKVLEGFFTAYLIPLIKNISSSTNANIRGCIAEVMPLMVNTINKLAPDQKVNVDRILHFIIIEDNINVLMSFSNSMKKIAGCSYTVFNSFFPILVSGVNSAVARFRIEVLDVFQICYDDCPKNERTEYSALYKKLFPAICGFLDEVQTQEVRAKLLETLLWFSNNHLIEKSRYPELYKMIKKLDSCSDQQSLYFIRKLLKAMPKEFSIHGLPDFLWSFMCSSTHALESPVKWQKANQTMSPAKRKDSRIANKTNLKPSFLSSERVTDKGFTCCVGINSKGMLATSSDSKGNIYLTTEDMVTNIYLENVSPLSCMTSLDDGGKTLYGARNGMISLIDWTNGLMTQINAIGNTELTSLTEVEHNAVVATSRPGILSFLDFRTKCPAGTLSFDDLASKCSCAWSNTPYFAVGFEEGIVDIIDMRMNLPVYSVLTNSPNQILAVDASNLSFAITSSGLNFYTATEGNFLSFSEGTDVVMCNSGRKIVCADNEDVYCINSSDINDSYIALDPLFSEKLKYKDNCLLKPRTKSKGKSLHKHTVLPSCLCKSNNIFLSFDSIGFVNLWTLSK